MGQKLWDPPAELVENALMTKYMRSLERGFESYEELHRWSVEELEAFWASIWDHFGVAGGYDEVLPDRSMPGAVWFTGARLNYAEHAFRGKPDDRVAIVHASELRDQGEVTWGELREQVAGIAAGLRALGVERGDRVAAYMPNIPEATAAFLATASIGAVWSSCSPDFGARSVIDRFEQIEPKVLLAVDGYRYNGKDFDRADTVAGIHAEVGGTLVRLGYLDGTGWEDGFLGEAELEFERVPFDHPLWVLYSSGTTGLPKAIVQGQGGILIEHLKKLNLHVNAQEGDRVFWFTTTGWMMWNFLVSCLLTEAAIVLYDGSPGHPDMGVLWDLAESAQITTFGTSASYIASCMKAGVEPGQGRDLSRLTAVGSTGSLLPVYEGELQARALGCAVESWSPEGESLIGEVGELVITEPMPSMPIFFWNDPEGERYRESYFDMFPGVWRHGDWIEITERGTAIITGRSDSTINRGGIRMGTAEIYRAVLSIDDITDALVVDVPRDGEENFMPLFVVLREGASLEDHLVRAIRDRIREDCSPRHVPNEVVAVREVPRTLSGKVLELPVKRILQGTPPEKAASRDSLSNPKALDFFVEYAGAG